MSTRVVYWGLPFLVLAYLAATVISTPQFIAPIITICVMLVVLFPLSCFATFLARQMYARPPWKVMRRLSAAVKAAPDREPLLTDDDSILIIMRENRSTTYVVRYNSDDLDEAHDELDEGAETTIPTQRFTINGHLFAVQDRIALLRRNSDTGLVEVNHDARTRFADAEPPSGRIAHLREMVRALRMIPYHYRTGMARRPTAEDAEILTRQLLTAAPLTPDQE